MKPLHSLTLGLCLALVGPLALAESPIALRSGESADLHPVYWAINCQSRLEKFAGAEVLDGPPELHLSIREEPIVARRQGCADKIPGGTVVLTADALTEKKSVTLKYRVQYETRDGRKQSSHSVQVDLYP